MGGALTGAPALAQRAPVTVDLGALDALPPPNPTTTPPDIVRLHRPRPATEPTTTAKPAAKAASVQANVPRPTPPLSAPTVAPSARPNPPGTSAQAATASPPTTPPATPPPPSAASQQQALAPAATAAIGAPPAPPSEAPKRILFRPDESGLPNEAKAELDGLATRLTLDGHLYVQLVAYAGGSGDASQARRLSLTRALAARSYLVERGVEIKQIDVRPLGNKTEPGLAPDRIDLVVAQR